ncbi:c-type cytochrome [Sphingomonas flavalba]|uniref:c-type cytochrome n=1 Tax=Sphingomonas flavalba TaxID=2559804 RepID=UPI00109E3564|nr:cytochrome c [Sphingomonas flavalba]
MIRFVLARAGAPLLMLLGGGAAAVAAFASAGQAPERRSVADGVYSAAQAQRGMGLYIRQCSACHGELFNGGESGPALADPEFLGRWRGMTVGQLYEKIMTTMPPLPDTPGKAGPQGNIDMVAAILHANAFPAGAREVIDPAELDSIAFD